MVWSFRFLEMATSPLPPSTLLEGRGAKAHEQRGRTVKDDRLTEGTALHKLRHESAEEWEEAKAGRVAPILDGPGAEPPLSDKKDQSPQAT
jgi:hypothetical protein